ncbi:hypothetical protein ACWEVP_35795 [Amycolatopsis sp. NPDC003865]
MTAMAAAIEAATGESSEATTGLRRWGDDARLAAEPSKATFNRLAARTRVTAGTALVTSHARRRRT